MHDKNTGLFTDLYELTMAQGYFLSGRRKESACFDYYFRKAPFEGSYVVFAGLRTFFEALQNLRFSDKDCNFLKSIGFYSDFLDFLLDFRFDGDIYSPEEGELVFPQEPVIRVEANLIAAQIIETLLLNTINFESLIATKASRMKYAAKEKKVAEFGLRRAHGFGGIQASRAAIIGGADSTSNVYAAKEFGCEATGTQAHSWVQSFRNELTAFREYAKVFPDNCILLVDTYNTVKSGIPNAITVAKQLKKDGYMLKGIRLDSGNMEKLSKIARKMLDSAGFPEVKIIASNQLDEFIIEDLIAKGAAIDVFGVGTSLATGNPDGALDGIYKLSVSNGTPKLKLSENPEKISFPGYKKVLRFENEQGCIIADGVILEHDFAKDGYPDINLQFSRHYELLKLTMKQGESLLDKKTIVEIRENTLAGFAKLPLKYKSFRNAPPYPVGFGKNLLELRKQLIDEILLTQNQ